ncbi:coiled-coil domain-containing protein [Pseudomonas massiliensis]|uniref:hypothetical protein n=1 Tax=Pseudomonas massiliensis TaxID=522492 RepID=UPI0011DE0075|nr:hypothetical protein [Pseudomonas massiliensis]
MNNRTASRQDLQIVEAFSSVSVPEQIVRESNIKELVKGMTDAQASVQSTASKLERARREQKEGNWFGNLLNDRADAVQDAQLDLNKSIGSLTQKSSQLLIVNTAISKMLYDQQGVLQQQQHVLKNQADTLTEQNGKIFQQQLLLEKQQHAINAANEGLLQAKGISQEQAQKLVGCVVRVTEAEKSIQQANQRLSDSVDHRLQVSSEDCLAQLSEGLAARDQYWQATEQRVQEALVAQDTQRQHEQVALREQLTVFEGHLQQQLQNSAQALEFSLAAQQQVVQGLDKRFVAQVAVLQQSVAVTAQQGLLAVEQAREALQADDAQLALDLAVLRERLIALDKVFEEKLQASVQMLESAVAAQQQAVEHLDERFVAQIDEVQQALQASTQHSQLAVEQAREACEAGHAQLAQEQSALHEQLAVLKGLLASNVDAQQQTLRQMDENFTAQLNRAQQSVAASAKQGLVAVRHMHKLVTEKVEATCQTLEQSIQAQGESFTQSVEELVAELGAACKTLSDQQLQVSDLRQALKRSQQRHWMGLLGVGVLALGPLVWQAALYWLKT